MIPLVQLAYQGYDIHLVDDEAVRGPGWGDGYGRGFGNGAGRTLCSGPRSKLERGDGRGKGYGKGSLRCGIGYGFGYGVGQGDSPENSSHCLPHIRQFHKYEVTK